MTITSPTSAANIPVTQSTYKPLPQEPIFYARNEAKISESRLPTPNETTNEIDDLLLTGNKDNKAPFCVTYIGYSGMSYDDIEGVKETVKSQLEGFLRDHPDEQIVVVCGGTSVGIGAVYDVVAENPALRKNIKCIGIVSECAPKQDLVQSTDQFKVGIVHVPDPKQSWQTKLSDGDQEHQAMIYPAQKFGGVIIAFGAGGIGYDEINEAKDKGLEIMLFPSQPDNSKLQDRLKKNSDFSKACPLLYHEFGLRL
ncbi:hypothetical protein PUG81_24120 [Erwiniaceae bacterium L1_54_6]|nr:hypothetical protein [Erwiniaceae bacterium L1_54_6]